MKKKIGKKAYTNFVKIYVKGKRDFGSMHVDV